MLVFPDSRAYPMILAGVVNRWARSNQLDPYIQDALDLIEFANGATTSEWGEKRAALGHPEPFHLKMMEVGNEQWGPAYIERYARFAKAIKAKHPGLQLVSAAGPEPADDRFKFAWSELRVLNADIIDEHCYAAPAWFVANVHRYDDYDRNGPKVFMGEYAAQSDKVVSVFNRNNLNCAIAEAAYMTGLERNADVVRLASYAPLFANSDAWQWTPDLIWVNSLGLYATPGYFVQQLFGKNRGDVVLPARIARAEGSALSPAPQWFVSAARDESAGEVIVKFVNAGDAPASVLLKLAGADSIGSEARGETLTGAAKSDHNSFEEPAKVAPVAVSVSVSGVEFPHTFPANSFTVLRLKVSPAK